MEMKKTNNHVRVKMSHGQFNTIVESVKFYREHTEYDNGGRLARIYKSLLEAYNSATDASKSAGEINKERYLSKISNLCYRCGTDLKTTRLVQDNNGQWSRVCKDCLEAFY